jgi:hypothetical protein
MLEAFINPTQGAALDLFAGANHRPGRGAWAVRRFAFELPFCALLSGTESSNPLPSSGESANHRYRCLGLDDRAAFAERGIVGAEREILVSARRLIGCGIVPR